MLICPENSRFAIRHNRARNIFDVTDKKGEQVLLSIPYDEGKYMYATLRGQQRLEEMGMPSVPYARGQVSKDEYMRSMTSSSLSFTNKQLQRMWQQRRAVTRMSMRDGHGDPSTTHRYVYYHRGVAREPEPFVHTEDDLVRTGMDTLPRQRNRKENCHVAARTFARMAGREPTPTTIQFTACKTFLDLLNKIKELPTPLLLEVATLDTSKKHGLPYAAHSCVVYKATSGEYICYEKVGNGYPWRLAPLAETFAMYSEDFTNANIGLARVFWTVKTLPEKQKKEREKRKKK
jgi:hypothetical protein